jgi:hypothetical protein
VPILAVSLNSGEHGLGCEIAEEKEIGICSGQNATTE